MMTKVWFVTGSSRGLGREIVKSALNAGDKVVATARRPEQLNDLAEKFGERVLPVALDVTSSADVEKAVREGHEAFGRYDVVVNNAGYGDTASIEDTTLEDFKKQIDTNFLGVVYVTKAVLPIPILRQHGSHLPGFLSGGSHWVGRTRSLPEREVGGGWLLDGPCSRGGPTRHQGNGSGTRRHEDRLGWLFDDYSSSKRTPREDGWSLRKDAA